MTSRYCTIVSFSAVFALSNYWVAPATRGADSSTRANTSKPVLAAEHKTGTSARDFLGQDVQSTQGADLGEVKDLVVKTDTGKVVYALVTTGGVAGIGETIRAVPFAAVQRSRPANGSIVLDLKDADWSTAPTIQEHELGRLAADDRGRSIFEYFSREWDDLRDRRTTSGQSADKFARVSEVIGKEVEHAGREVGDIEDVVIDFNHRRASVLLDPNDEFTGSNEKFIIRFSQLSSGAASDDAFTTALTSADFARATPLDNKSWVNDADYPYLWTGYGFVWTPYTAFSDPNVTGRPTLNVVRGALQSAASLSDQAQQASITREGDKLVLSGTVESEAMKQRVTEIVQRTADGWTVDNQIEVAAATE